MSSFPLNSAGIAVAHRVLRILSLLKQRSQCAICSRDVMLDWKLVLDDAKICAKASRRRPNASACRGYMRAIRRDEWMESEPINTSLEVTDRPRAAELEFLQKKLAEFNDSDVGIARKQALAVFVLSEDGEMVAGISGYTAWGWLYVQWLWVDERLRGQGMARRMLEDAEKEAIARGCHGALIDTFNPIALKTYQNQGYSVFGVLPDFPVGRSRTFLQKTLRAKE